MAKKGPTLESLRLKIDEIDSKLHALLMARASLSLDVAKAKAADQTNPATPVLPVRAAREAQMMNTLLQRHSGPLPAQSLLRIWREIIGASANLQTPMRIMVAALKDPVSAFDAARGLYGMAAPLSLAENPRQVLRALATGSIQLGVLPEPGQQDAASWWTALVDAPFGARILARLPFLPIADAHGEVERFVVLAQAPAEPSGSDMSYLGLSCRNKLSSDGLATKLQQAGLAGRRIAMVNGQNADAYHLVEVDGFLATDDNRLEKLRETMDPDLLNALVLGAYPTDISTVVPDPAK